MKNFAAFLFAALLAASAAPAAEIPAFAGGEQVSPSDQSQAEIPLDRSNIESTALLPWTVQTITAAYSLEPDGYQAALKKVTGDFSKSGWSDFTSVLNDHKVIDQITQEKMTVSIETGNPALLSEGKDDEGKYRWLISIPATISYYAANASDSRSEKTIITIAVMRVPRTENVLGIQITAWSQT